MIVIDDSMSNRLDAAGWNYEHCEAFVEYHYDYIQGLKTFVFGSSVA